MNTTNIATRLIAGAIVTALVSSLSSIASAAEGTDSLHKTIQYTDLSVSSAQGAATLYNRIRLASEEVCSPLDHGDLSSKMHAEACMHKAIADAVSQVNRPALTAVYNARNGGSLPMIAAAK
jgi:UrcA family protein